jgi:citrate lyase beta subunit
MMACTAASRCMRGRRCCWRLEPYSKAVIDAVHLDIADLEGLGAEARDAAALGFTATACIHHSQVAVVHQRGSW